MVRDFQIYTDKILAEASVTAQKNRKRRAIITVEETATAVEEADFSVDKFVSSFKYISGCQNVDLDDIEKWLAADKEVQQETLSNDEIIGADADVTQGNDDFDINDLKATLIISHTDEKRHWKWLYVMWNNKYRLPPLM